MSDSAKLALAKARLQRLESSPKNIKCGGVVRKVKRDIRHLSASVNS